MTYLIDKDALVAEITKRKKRNVLNEGAFEEDIDILSFINTLEAKEVDLDESARNYLLHEHISPLNAILHQADLKAEIQYHKDIENAYKAGFELGLKSQKR